MGLRLHIQVTRYYGSHARTLRSSIGKLRGHLRENGWSKTVRDVPLLLRRRLGDNGTLALPATPQAPERNAGEPGQGVGEITRRYTWVRQPEDERRRERDVLQELPPGVPLVSVIIPCYNQAHFLGDAIESVLDQTYPYFEIIVVDDGSPDNTSEVAAGYPAVRCIRQENRGLAGARNGGIPHARGDYLLFLDSDDRLMPGAIETHLEYLEAYPECAFVCGQQRVIDADGSLLKILRRPLIGADLYATLLARSHFVIPGSVMYRREIFDEVDWFDPAVNGAADYDLYFRIARRHPVYWHDKVVLEYRRHGSNMTTNRAANMLADTVAALRAQKPHIQGNARYLEAYEAGMLKGQETYGIPLAEKVREHLKEGRWGEALRNMTVLRRYYPRGLTLLSNKRLERQKLARRVRQRRQQLAENEKELEKLERHFVDARTALEEQRRTTAQIRDRTRYITRQAEGEAGLLNLLARRVVGSPKKQKAAGPDAKQETPENPEKV